MLHCPTDESLLRRSKAGTGIVWLCDRCHGRAVMLPVLRRELAPDVARELWSRSGALEKKLRFATRDLHRRPPTACDPLRCRKSSRHPTRAFHRNLLLKADPTPTPTS